MASPPPLDESQLRSVIDDLAATFDQAKTLTGIVPEGHYESHTSVLYKLTRPGSGTPDALLKVGSGWTADQARAIYEDLVSLAGLLAGEQASGLSVPPPLGWHGSPPSVCITYVDGEDLGHLLRTGDGHRSPRVESVMRDCGRALGLFHGRSATSELAVDLDETREELRRMARSVMTSPRFLDSLDLQSSIRRRYGDFAPYNIRLASDGTAWLIDHPSEPALAPVHRDAAWFLFNLERRLGWQSRVGRSELEEARSRLRAAFLQGYGETAPRTLDTSEDEALLALYRAHRSLWTARKRLRQRELGEVPDYLRLAMRWRRVVARYSPGSPVRDEP